MEVIFQDNIGFLYDVCRVVICKSNKRESWINDFLCDGSEEEDSIYIDNLLKKFQGIDISNKLLGYKLRKNQEALLGELYGSYLEEKLGQVEIDGFLGYIADSNRLRERIAEYYLCLETAEKEFINEVIFTSQLSKEIKSELYSFNLFTEKYIEAVIKELKDIIDTMKQMYMEAAYTINRILKPRFQINDFLKNMKEYLQNDSWESGVNRYTVTFSFLNRYLVTRQIDKMGNGVIILGIEYMHFFLRKKSAQIDLVSFGNALGDKMRMKMITLLCENGELSLTDFSNKLDIVNAVALYHLDILKEAKVILRRNEGRRVLYWLNCSQFSKAIQEITKIVGRCQ